MIRALYRDRGPAPGRGPSTHRLPGARPVAFFAMDHLRRAFRRASANWRTRCSIPRSRSRSASASPSSWRASDSQRALDDCCSRSRAGEFVVRFRCATAMGQIRARCPDLHLSQRADLGGAGRGVASQPRRVGAAEAVDRPVPCSRRRWGRRLIARAKPTSSTCSFCSD